jgi:antitoxin component YwqK of YwqJK toxin-antitoxin module
MDILNNNIIEYVLNQYLDYDKDIIKLKKLYENKFSIKPHIRKDIKYYNFPHNSKQKEWLHVYTNDNHKLYLAREYYSNGQIRKNIKYNLNNLHLRNEKSYYMNGDKISEINFKDDLKHGKCKFYFNGKLNTVEYYTNDKINGTWKYYINGKLNNKRIYKNGKFIGNFHYHNIKINFS